jgi:hypothetical protein
VIGSRVADSASGVLHNLHDLADVLRAPMLAIRPPAKQLAVPVVADPNAAAPQQVNKARVAQGSRRLPGAEQNAPALVGTPIMPSLALTEPPQDWQPASASRSQPTTSYSRCRSQ